MVSNPKQVYEKILGRIIPREEWVNEWLKLTHKQALAEARFLANNPHIQKRIKLTKEMQKDDGENGI